jgi:aminomuconate-semialdehyde/2-hydroxymuconate-6-semialdehyde dehydrogenase
MKLHASGNGKDIKNVAFSYLSRCIMPDSDSKLIREKHTVLRKLLPETWGHFIDGEYQSPSTSGSGPGSPKGENGILEVLAPATDERLGHIPLGEKALVDQAVDAAERAFHGPWGSTPMEKRAEIVRTMGELIHSRRQEFAELESLDTGKPISETYSGDVVRAARNLRIFSELAAHSSGKVFRSDDGAEHITVREPIGVVGLITPWNLPLHLATWKIAPALMQGNTIVLKPAEWTPLSAMALGKIAREAGLPPGVLNIIHGLGPQAAGEALVRHPKIKAISFTGESSTGSAIMAAGSQSLKKLSFELGGKGATVVFADADLEKAAGTACRAAFRNQGQICLAGSRILVERSIADRFVGRLIDHARAIRMGDPLDPQTTMGSLIHKTHRERVHSYVGEALETPHVKLLCGGAFGPGRGAYYQPTLLLDVDQKARIIQEEVFGPVATIQIFDGFDEALTLLNGTKYGLSCSVFTENIAKAQRFSRLARMGLVWINDWFLRDLHTAFGGMKHSGLGREGGEYSLDFYSEIKTISYGSPGI